MRNETLVFYHIAKTGGSSVWHNLAKSATPNCFFDDIFHRIESSEPGRDGHYSKVTSRKFQEEIYRGHFFLPSEGKLFIHHHDAVPLCDFFSGARFFSTIRDPRTRLLSQIRHLFDPIGNPWFLENLDGHSEAEVLDYCATTANRTAYRRWFSAIFAEDFDDAMRIHSGAKPVIPDGELLELIEKHFVLLLELEEGGGFSAEATLAFNRLVGANNININDRYLGTVTKQDALGVGMERKILALLDTYLADDMIFYEGLKKLSKKKTESILSGESDIDRTERDPQVSEEFVQRMLHWKCEESLSALSAKDAEIEKLAAAHEQLVASFSYRLGRVITSPWRIAQKLNARVRRSD